MDKWIVVKDSVQQECLIFHKHEYKHALHVLHEICLGKMESGIRLLARDRSDGIMWQKVHFKDGSMVSIGLCDVSYEQLAQEYAIRWQLVYYHERALNMWGNR